MAHRRKPSAAILKLRREARELSAASVAVTWSSGPRHGIPPWDAALVDPDGTVRLWDPVGEMYSLLHSLTVNEEDEIRSLANPTR